LSLLSFRAGVLLAAGWFPATRHFNLTLWKGVTRALRKRCSF